MHTVPVDDAVTDLLDIENIYVIVRPIKLGADSHVCMSVYVCNSTAGLHQKFLLRDKSSYALTFNDEQKVIVVANKVVNMHEADGQFVRSIERCLGYHLY